MGFEPQLRKIIQSRAYGIPNDGSRQTALFSATFPPDVALLARDFLRGSRCISLNIVHNDKDESDLIVPQWGQAVKRGHQSNEDIFRQLKATVPREIVQEIQWVEDDGEARGYHLLERLVIVLNRAITDMPIEKNEDASTEHFTADSNDRILVFCNTKREADRVDRYLVGQGFKSVCIHGDRSQQQRSRVVQLFRTGQVNVLVATSVNQLLPFWALSGNLASRGRELISGRLSRSTHFVFKAHSFLLGEKCSFNFY
ncbi:unnamed protein product [Mesocestoides corti]|uniref:Helicase C-terminal domain-containing protein n=2 Tax=Mesocestoides corti TaxID=53468 RepID=A0A0R3UDB1_MESCO|nr:unnamed protein product [Mesocestoides corti]